MQQSPFAISSSGRAGLYPFSCCNFSFINKNIWIFLGSSLPDWKLKHLVLFFWCCSFLCKTYSCQLILQLSPKETDMTQYAHTAVKKLTSASEFENNTAKSKEYFIRGFGNTQMETKIYNWIQRVYDVVLSWQLLSSIVVGLSHCQLGP